MSSQIELYGEACSEKIEFLVRRLVNLHIIFYLFMRTNPHEILNREAQNPHKILNRETQNPHKILNREAQNPHKILKREAQNPKIYTT